MPDSTRVACSEVWGGNGAADAALVLPGLAGWIVSRPFRGAAAGGDVHYVSSCGTGRITRVLLADVSGHGDEAAGVAERLRAMMLRFVNTIDPHKLATALNHGLVEGTAAEGRFASAMFMTYFSPTGGLSLCNAGHPPPAVYRGAAQSWSFVQQPETDRGIYNLPLGVLEESGYAGRELFLEPGDLVLAYTDCLMEARRSDGRQLGLDGLLDALNTLGPASAFSNPGELTAALIRQIESTGHACDDDLTAVVLRCTERVGGAPFASRMAGMARALGNVFTRGIISWPEMSVANLLGPFLPRLNASRRRRLE